MIGPLIRFAQFWEKAWMEPIQATFEGEEPWRRVFR
jgi:hypothetical protein